MTLSKLAQKGGESSFELNKTHGIPLEDASLVGTLKMLGYIGQARDMVVGLKAHNTTKSVAARWKQPETLARLALSKALEDLIGHHGTLLKGTGEPAPAPGPLLVGKALQGLIGLQRDLQGRDWGDHGRWQAGHASTVRTDTSNQQQHRLLGDNDRLQSVTGHCQQGCTAEVHTCSRALKPAGLGT